VTGNDAPVPSLLRKHRYTCPRRRSTKTPGNQLLVYSAIKTVDSLDNKMPSVAIASRIALPIRIDPNMLEK
jgi:hypothetical protein